MRTNELLGGAKMGEQGAVGIGTQGENPAIPLVARQKQVEIGIAVSGTKVGIAVTLNDRAAQPDVIKIGSEAKAQYVARATVYLDGVGVVQA